MEELEKRDWQRLVRTIQRGCCILLLGPDVAVDPAEPNRTPLTIKLARKLASQLKPESPVANEDDLSHVAQLYYQQCRDRIDLEITVDDFYRPLDDKSTPFHSDLAALPFSLCINTTPDRLMYNALQDVPGKSPVADFYNFRKDHPSQLGEPDSDHPIVYDLYGHRGEPESLVLTENDLLEFLVNVVSGTPALAPSITSQFSDPDTSFLFLGFGFHHWYVRILLHVLKAHGHRNRSLALEDTEFFSHPEQPETAVFFEQAHSIEFKRLSWSDFAGELRRQYESFAATAAGPKLPELPEEAPKVFLCHCSQDREQIVKLEQQLHAQGIDTWRDRRQLRGGDDWDRLIQHVIQKQVHYVVVAQSRSMTGRVESYFHLEIDQALDRQRKFGGEFNFVIPLLLEDCTGLERLSHLHSIEVMKPQGVEDLVRAIKDDWKKRRARQDAA